MSEAETPPTTVRRGSLIWRVGLWGHVPFLTLPWLAFCAFFRLPSSREWVDVMFFSLLVWQCEMLGFWAGLGKSNVRWIAIAIVAPLPGFFSSVAAGGEVAEFQVFSFGVLTVVALTCAVLRRFAGSLQRTDDFESGRDGLQFGIRQVMIWTGAIALALGGARYLLQLREGRVAVNGNPEIFMLAACMSGSTVVTVWALLGKQLLASRVFTLMIVMTFGVLLTHYISHESMFTISTFVSQGLVMVSIAFLRVNRYRFLNRSKTA